MLSCIMAIKWLLFGWEADGDDGGWVDGGGGALWQAAGLQNAISAISRHFLETLGATGYSGRAEN